MHVDERFSATRYVKPLHNGLCILSCGCSRYTLVISTCKSDFYTLQLFS